MADEFAAPPPPAIDKWLLRFLDAPQVVVLPIIALAFAILIGGVVKLAPL